MKGMARRETAQLTFEGVTNPLYYDESLSSNWNLDESKTLTDERIRDRENKFKLICWGVVTIFTTILLLLFIYNIVVGNYKFTFADLRFSDLLSLTMAIFAIFLSIAFYFKASETSNTFYNNTYHFTRHVSELLGRIESGFKEKLIHIDEGQTAIRARVDNIPAYVNPESTKKEISEGEQKLKKELAEREELIKQLVENSALQGKEKDDFVSQLNEKQHAIDDMRKEIGDLHRRLNHETKDIKKRSKIPFAMARYIESSIPRVLAIPRHKINEMSVDEIKFIFEKDIGKLNNSFIRDMKSEGFIDTNDKLTGRGLEFVYSNIIRQTEEVSDE
jgi:hypothetical protein